MTQIDQAAAIQRQALRPAESVWVAASAGTGKTKVLTDRLLALMLDGTDPARILCLTFTRAAAAEMANRLNARLAAWATLPPGKLAEELVELTGRYPDEYDTARSRPQGGEEGRPDEARAAYERALGLTIAEPERRFLARRIAEL